MKDFSILATSLKVGGVTLPNRYCVAPMTGGNTNNHDSFLY